MRISTDPALVSDNTSTSLAIQQQYQILSDTNANASIGLLSDTLLDTNANASIGYYQVLIIILSLILTLILALAIMLVLAPVSLLANDIRYYQILMITSN